MRVGTAAELGSSVATAEVADDFHRMMQVDDLIGWPGAEPATLDNVRLSTPQRYNHRIDQAMMKRVWEYARKSPVEISRRIEELEREWDLERVLESSAGAIALSGIVLSGLHSRKWLLVPAGILTVLLKHALLGNSAPIACLRRMGIRTRREIDAEKYALRTLRGDFDNLKTVGDETHRAIEAVRLNRP
jgi:hypothetical protein